MTSSVWLLTSATKIVFRFRIEGEESFEETAMVAWYGHLCDYERPDKTRDGSLRVLVSWEQSYGHRVVDGRSSRIGNSDW